MFDPRQSQKDDIVILENALIVPRGEGRARGIAQPAGIYDKAGAYHPVGQCWRDSSHPTTIEPTGIPQGEEHKRRGTWIFGGILYNHFGHALLESTARLWVRDLFPDAKGVLFLLKKNVARPKQYIKQMQPMLRMFGGDFSRVEAVTSLTRVKKLVIPPQGFGTGDLIAGSPEYRDHVRRKLAGIVTPSGAEKIYISRRRLYSKRGRYLAEDVIEALLEGEGYRIFHPQEHSLGEQAAQYAAAKMVISSDSSALHLAAFFARPDSRLAILLRRPGAVIEDYLTQYEWFASVKPDIISALNGRYYQFAGAKLSQFNELYSEIDLSELGRMLVDAGYISDASEWRVVPRDRIEAERAELVRRLGVDIVPVEIDA